MMLRAVLVLIVAASLAGCGSEEPVGLDGFETDTIKLDGTRFLVAVADTPDQRAQGLMGVTDLGGLDGMLFVFPTDTPTQGGFWMKNTLIPLDIAFFDANGMLVDRLAMEPCTADPCPSYHPSGAYRYALEAPEGDLTFVVPGTRLEFVVDEARL